MANTGDLSKAEYRVMEVLTSRPEQQEWTSLEVGDAIRETDPRTSYGSVFVSLERLTWKDYVERRFGEPEAKRHGRGRAYYRATSDGTRAYDNTKTASRPCSASPTQKPAFGAFGLDR
jgi:predicted transcriptional regulator